MLILFDIDATLITTSRTGIAAMGIAGRRLHGPHFNEHTVDYAGRLDPLIIADLLRAHDKPITPETISAFRDAYHEALIELLKPEGIATPCPGVPALLQALNTLEDHTRPTLGLLTGNYELTGSVKLRRCGIEPMDFAIRVWGDASKTDPPHRSHLPPIALRMAAEILARDIPPHHAAIIGDTPHDVSCAKDNGMRVLAVATGKYSVDELRSAGADLALPTLEDTDAVMRWILQTQPG
ncbi:MAG: HAD family hydrolase [Phycisphaerales bacterium]